MNAKGNIKKLKIFCCHIKQIQFAHISCGKTYHRFLHQLNTHIPVDTELCYVLISIRTISYSFICTIVPYSYVFILLRNLTIIPLNFDTICICTRKNGVHFVQFNIINFQLEYFKAVSMKFFCYFENNVVKFVFRSPN